MAQKTHSIHNREFVCSWSGGKDSCLSLYRAIQSGGKPVSLLTMLHESGNYSRSHALSLNLLNAQADSMNLPLITRSTTWDDYENTFIDALKNIHKNGITAAVFGDIDIEDHRLWEEKVCAAAGLEAFLPIWQNSRLALLEEFLESGFKATVIAANEEKLGNCFLGRIIDHKLISEFQQIGIDPCGENGEYHTVVTDGPVFSWPLILTPGKSYLQSGYWFLEMEVE
ncbi:MAG: diphthine--ammonia ligase [Anaerolineales bacterium]|nr:diphthine--ammonia ligase [Anaerolineales bacterium]